MKTNKFPAFWRLMKRDDFIVFWFWLCIFLYTCYTLISLSQLPSAPRDVGRWRTTVLGFALHMSIQRYLRPTQWFAISTKYTTNEKQVNDPWVIMKIINDYEVIWSAIHWKEKHVTGLSCASTDNQVFFAFKMPIQECQITFLIHGEKNLGHKKETKQQFYFLIFFVPSKTSKPILSTCKCCNTHEWVSIFF